ncbi:MAG TPA: FHA domain-containing protein [Bryobacteraceae bacterium]|nr:FHA domain-containing protein [Bryobacteraceae bacterium]
MEPDWTECAYCRSDSATPGPPPIPASAGSGYVRRPTVVEDIGSSGVPAGTETLQTPLYAEDRPLAPRPTPRPFKPVPAAPPLPPLSRPNVPSPSSQPIARKTVYRPEPPSGPAPLQPPPVLAQRKIVGMLVTYSWKPDGEIFPIREGRNLIGRDPDCEVCISVDQTMSGRNSHITFRTTFVVGDLVSMKGTDLNGDPIEQQFLSLPNYAVIRAGSTQFTFIAIQPLLSTGADSATSQEHP